MRRRVFWMSPSHADSKRNSTLHECSGGSAVRALRSIVTKLCADSGAWSRDNCGPAPKDTPCEAMLFHLSGIVTS